MSGIFFFKTGMLKQLKEFYTGRIGCTVWLEQADCVILKHGNMLFGFCDRDRIEREGMLTFFFEIREQVDRYYEKLKDIAVSGPVDNEKYGIYQFFARDPEGRSLEFQYFNHRTAGYYDGEELLVTRRSVRKFKPSPIPDEVLAKVLEICRYAPTALNTQGYYFRLIRDRGTIEWLSERRGSSTGPIAGSPMAVAICADSSLTKRPEQDGCIAAYHFMLAAWTQGLGTCWIAAMDREDIKERLQIPKEHYVATVTPLGYPEKLPLRVPERKSRDWFVRE
nr:nitroreductase family protein [candidate division Zixibacteria bacterium]